MSPLQCPGLVKGVVTKPREPSPLSYHSKNHLSFREYQTRCFCSRLCGSFWSSFHCSPAFCATGGRAVLTRGLWVHGDIRALVTSRPCSLPRARPAEQSRARARSTAAPSQALPTARVQRQDEGSEPGKAERSPRPRYGRYAWDFLPCSLGSPAVSSLLKKLTDFLEIPLLVLSPHVFCLFSTAGSW